MKKLEAILFAVVWTRIGKARKIEIEDENRLALDVEFGVPAISSELDEFGSRGGER